MEVVDSLFGRGMDQIEGGKDLVTGLNSVLKTAAESRCPDIAAGGTLIDPAAAGADRPTETACPPLRLNLPLLTPPPSPLPLRYVLLRAGV